jgi:hypothetical protein
VGQRCTSLLGEYLISSCALKYQQIRGEIRPSLVPAPGRDQIHQLRGCWRITRSVENGVLSPPRMQLMATPPGGAGGSAVRLYDSGA